VAIASRILARVLPGRVFRPIENAIQKYGYFGNYSSWDDARSASGGYDADLILGKVRDALLKVKRGEAVAERDSVLFSTVPYSFPVIAALLGAASRSDGALSVLDFGGSLGTSYFYFRAFPAQVKRLEWSIVEQPQGQARLQARRLVDLRVLGVDRVLLGGGQRLPRLGAR